MKQRSISRRLTIAIIAVVVSVTSVTVALVSLASAIRAREELGDRAEEYVASLAFTLDTIIWNLDADAIRNVGKAYAQNDLVERFRIVNTEGKLLYNLSREGAAPLVIRRHEIRHDAHLLGFVEVGLTTRHTLEVNRSLILSGAIAIITNTIVLVMATGFLLRRFLKKPLKQVNEQVNAYVSGRFDPASASMEFAEFQPLVEVLGRMANTIASQIAELRDAEMKYRGIFENASEGIYQTTPEGRFISANPALARILGYESPEELIRSFSDLGRQLYVDAKQRQAYLEQLQRSDEVSGLEVQLYRQDGSVIWVSACSRAVKDAACGLTRIDGFLEDITERKRNQEDLRAANESLRKAHAELEARVQARTRDLDEANRKLLDEVEERKRAEQEVAQRNRDLEAANAALESTQIQLLQAQKLESIGQLAAGIAHEINTPIQFIGDNTRFFGESVAALSKTLAKYQEALEGAAQGRTPSLDEVAKHREEYDLDYLLAELPSGVKDTLDGIQRVTSIVMALKEFSHPDSREKVLTDLNAAIQNTSIVCRSEWKYVADLTLDLDEGLPLVPCLPGDMNQVFMNLIVNAAHAIQEKVGNGGSKGTIHISTLCKDGQVCIRIADTGSGIKPDNMHRIFDPFFTTKEVGRGTGQGLAISRNIIVDKHGGRIDVESTVGQGSAFIIHLPLGAS